MNLRLNAIFAGRSAIVLPRGMGGRFFATGVRSLIKMTGERRAVFEIGVLLFLGISAWVIWVGLHD